MAKNDVKTFLTRVQGFTPVIDALAQELSTFHALVYGVVWRFCQMDDEVCTASTETLARMIGISRRTVWRYLKDLCEQGYLRDLTPDRRNVPHVYQDTGKAKILGLVEGVVEEDETVAERHSAGEVEGETVAQGHSSDNDGDQTVAESHSTVAERHSLPETVAESHSNCGRESHEESIKKRVLKRESRREAVSTVVRLFKVANHGAFPKGTQPAIETLFERFAQDEVLEVAHRMGHSFGFTIHDMRTVLESQQTRGP